MGLGSTGGLDLKGFGGGGGGCGGGRRRSGGECGHDLGGRVLCHWRGGHWQRWGMGGGGGADGGGHWSSGLHPPLGSCSPCACVGGPPLAKWESRPSRGKAIPHACLGRPSFARPTSVPRRVDQPSPRRPPSLGPLVHSGPSLGPPTHHSGPHLLFFLLPTLLSILSCAPLTG